MPELSIVVPLYNEEESLPLLVEKLLAALRPLGRSFELVLVDDGSSDRTAAVLRELAATTPELVAVRSLEPSSTSTSSKLRPRGRRAARSFSTSRGRLSSSL